MGSEGPEADATTLPGGYNRSEVSREELFSFSRSTLTEENG